MEVSAQSPGKRLTSSKIWRKSTRKKTLKYQNRTRELKNRVFQRTASEGAIQYTHFIRTQTRYEYLELVIAY
jgi:hypothetical protein